MSNLLLRRAVAIRRENDAYPSSLVGLAEPPASVRVAGALPAFDRAVAIVGTRRAEPEALDFAYDLGHVLAKRGCVVVSGGAIGIDAAAHEGALDADGTTVAVLPTGFEKPYPARNVGLFERIVERGCLLTEAEEDWQPARFTFLQRNRIVAALSRVTVVVQAPVRSGALSTARHARGLEKPVFVVPSAPWEARNGGGLKLLLEGARICAAPRDVLSVLVDAASSAPAGGGKEPENNSDIQGLNETEQKVLRAVAHRSRHPDELCRMTGIQAHTIQRTILKLLIDGVIQEQPGGRYRSCRRSRPT